MSRFISPLGVYSQEQRSNKMSKLVLMLLLNCAAAERAIIGEHAFIRQAPQTEALLTDTPQQSVSAKRGKGSRTTALEAVGKSGAAVVGGPVAAAAAPYAAAGAAKAVHLGRGLVSRHGSESQHLEFDTIAGTTAAVSLRPGNVTILVPLNQYISSAQVLAGDIRPVILKLDVDLKSQMRILAARHIDLKQDKKRRFDLKPAVERIEADVEEWVMPASFERLPDNVYQIRTMQPLTPAEYALVFRTKAKNGMFTENLALHAPRQEYGGGDPSRHKPGDLVSAGTASSELRVSPTEFIAFDFRVLP